MTYIQTDVNQPGILDLLFYKGSTGKALSNLAQTILQGPSGLDRGERELIAAYVSSLNDCEFCHNSHAAAAMAQKEEYPSMGRRLATKGYRYPPRFLRKFVVWMMNRKKN